VLLKDKRSPKILERRILETESWKRGYAAFHRLFKEPLGWFYLGNESGDTLLRIDSKSCCSWYSQSAACGKTCEKYLLDLARAKKSEKTGGFRAFSCHADKSCIFFPLPSLNESRTALILCNLKISGAAELSKAFHEFLKTQRELSQKNFELQNFYETVHPRALALSTMHAVHRVVSAVYNLEDLLPRIGRLSMQILKAGGCSVWLFDDERKYLVLKFDSEKADYKKKIIRKKAGLGFEGRIAGNGEICFKRNVLAIPFLDQDILGLIILRNKQGGVAFTFTDLEIFKILAEQTVVAIKNAKLYDETQQLTLGAVKSINELLELNSAGDNVHLPLFARLVNEIGKDMGLRGEELTDLGRAVLLLDTGYVGLPEKIRSKREKLTEEEYALIKEHPHRGVSVLKSVSSLKPVIPIVLHHHERFDGLGYPHGLKGEAIPIGARIIAVVDAFTAMISKRSYRRAKGIDEAVSEIKKQRGIQFDPHVVDSFLKVIAVEFPGVVEDLRK